MTLFSSLLQPRAAGPDKVQKDLAHCRVLVGGLGLCTGALQISLLPAGAGSLAGAVREWKQTKGGGGRGESGQRAFALQPVPCELCPECGKCLVSKI